MNKTILKVVLLLGVLILPISTEAHEIRPAYLEIKEDTLSNFKITWKVPIYNGRIPNLFPEFSPGLQLIEIDQKNSGNALTTVYFIEGPVNLQGRKIRIYNQERTLIDALVRIDFLDGAAHTLLLQPDQPEALIPVSASAFAVARTFIILGIEHIIFGWDHLLFVFGLLLLIEGRGRLLWTITAFTIAHSITLVLSSLGKLSLPSTPVEIVIALSVVFLGREYLIKSKGGSTLTMRRPWIVAFLFGLLHGFGFAGALGEIGLPGHALPLSLFSFNIGVEIGQIMFVAVIMLIAWILHFFQFKIEHRTKLFPGYIIGGIASFWFISRMLDIAG